MPAPPANLPPCLVYAAVEVGPGALERVTALLAAYPVTSLLLTPRPGEALAAAAVRPLVDLIQKKNCAALLADDAALARTLRADGVHLKAGIDLPDRYDEARSILGAGAIVGGDAGGSRHLAMQLGEAGADYVGFSGGNVTDDAPAGTPDETADDEAADDFGPRSQDTLIAWWSQVFEVPCVAFDAATPEAARTFAQLGADFVAVAFGGGESVPASVERLKAFVRAVEETHVA